MEAPPRLEPFTAQEKAGLLRFSRESLERALRTRGQGKSWAWDGSEPSPVGLPADVVAGVFVTLMKSGKLRGCVGTMAPQPLLPALAKMTLQSASSDPRFPPVALEELSEIKMEISILSPMRRASGPQEIVPGRHGVCVKRGSRVGLFLPQVWEALPDKTEFLEELCRSKAGLPADAWKDPGTELHVFTVEVFEEGVEK